MNNATVLLYSRSANSLKFVQPDRVLEKRALEREREREREKERERERALSSLGLESMFGIRGIPRN